MATVVESDEQLRKVASRFFIHKPDDLAQGYVNWAAQRQKNPGVTWGCKLDNYIIPMQGGDLTAIVARPGGGKTSMMAYMARRKALQIQKEGREDQVALFVSWEQRVEEIEAYFESIGRYSVTDLAWNRLPLSEVEAGSIGRGTLPLWLLGESARHEGVRRPTMTFEYVYAAIESMKRDYGVKPALVCLDYIQNIPVTRGMKKMEQVDEAIHEAKLLAIRAGIPIIVGVQSTRKVDDYSQPIPMMSDAQWSSAIEQVADKQLALWRPIKTHDPFNNPTVEIGGVTYKNDDNLMVVRLLKQRFDSGSGTWAIRFNMATLEVTDYTTHAIHL